MPTKRSHILEQTFLFKYVWPFSGHQALELKEIHVNIIEFLQATERFKTSLFN